MKEKSGRGLSSDRETSSQNLFGLQQNLSRGGKECNEAGEGKGNVRKSLKNG